MHRHLKLFGADICLLQISDLFWGQLIASKLDSLVTVELKWNKKGKGIYRGAQTGK